jgi:hypothetical protein
VQFLLGPNYSPQGGSDLTNGFMGAFLQQNGLPQLDLGFRFFHIGGKIIADLGFGTVALTAKTQQWPIEAVNAMYLVFRGQSPNFPGGKTNFLTFGANFDITAVENLGISLGYTGMINTNDADDVESILWNGIDLRAMWTGIEGLSLSTHNNISFAAGKEKDWMDALGKDGTFLTLYNAVGMTKELNEKFSVNAEIANVWSKTENGTDSNGDDNKINFEEFFAGAKLITHVTENVEFDAGLAVTFTKHSTSGDYGDANDSLTVFSVPVTVKVSF